MRTITAVRAAGWSDPGLLRDVNEDRYYCDPARGLFAVVDGLGGQAAGGRAADIALSMLRQALDAFARLDTAQAASIIRQDMAIDIEFRSILRQLITFMMEDPRTISTALEIVWIAKAVERIGDHAKNIAEDVIYIVKGTDVRHTAVEVVEREALG